MDEAGVRSALGSELVQRVADRDPAHAEPLYEVGFGGQLLAGLRWVRNSSRSDSRTTK